MITLLGYQITPPLHDSDNSLVFRGKKPGENQSVILKMLKQAYPPPEKLAQFKREYEITKRLNFPGVVQAYSLESDNNRPVMILEDFGGYSLAQLLDRGETSPPTHQVQREGRISSPPSLSGKGVRGLGSLADFLTLAIQVTDSLGQIHQQQIIHKDINLSNIVFNPKTRQVKFIDFGISTLLTRENITFCTPNLLEGTLAYISPEQTGRMNRAIDYRTDFYSLGVTFYELLTGQLPFPIDDVLELIHCHIAKQPVPPIEFKPEIPPILSDIVLKLMAKNAEDRYQSAYGLLADLEECQRQWQAKGQIDAFRLARHDVSDRFQIPQKLYGREREVETLLAAFERVGAANVGAGLAKNLSHQPITSQQNPPPSSPSSASEMILVSGYSGIGKSALVQEVYKPLTGACGYFISGKFDQFQRNIPYTSLIQAFRGLVQQLLAETEAKIAVLREKLLAALGTNARVIIDVIPEVELIVGSQPEVPDLSPSEAQNRFNLVFQNFIKVFTQPEHPLALFLDDLQWADGASLKLIQVLMTAADSEYLFLIGAYRDNEVSPVHPLMLTLDEIKKANANVSEIALSPLSLPHVTELISDLLHSEAATVLPLAELVHSKTGGNPFFATEFLKTLHAEELLTFNYQRGSWQWDLEPIRARQIADNVVDLMASKVQKLPPQTQAALKFAACIGNQFNLEMLAIAYEKSPRETASDLWPALADGLILPLSDAYKLMEMDVEGLSRQLVASYKFAHDRIQQAIYSLIPNLEKQAVHRRVGQQMLRNTPPEKLEKQLFDIVNHLNQGQTLIDGQAERDELAKLNLQAGKKAKASTAYQAAFNYLQVGRELLGEASWNEQYNLMLELYVEASESAYLIGEFQAMERLVESVLQQAQTLLEKVKVYEVRMLAYSAQSQHLESVKTALQVLKLLGVTFPEQPSQSDIIVALQETQSVLASRQIEDLINLPPMTDPLKLAAMQIMSSVWNGAYIAMNSLVPLLVCQQVNLSLACGNAPDSAFAYVNYGFILCGMGDIDTGYQLGKLALGILERFNAKKFQAKTYVLYDFSKHLKEPLRDLLTSQLKAYRSGLENGDFEFAASGGSGYCMLSHYSGKELAIVEREMASYHQAISQLKQEACLNWHKIFWQSVLTQLGRSENPCLLKGEGYDEEKMLPLHLEANDNSSLLHLYTQKLILCYQFQEFEQAFKNAVKLETYIVNAATMWLAPPAYLYDSLARLAVFADASETEKERLLEKVAANQEKMELWARHAPMNYLHKYYLVEAERARVLGNHSDAREHYDRAISLAHENEYINEEALAYELAGRFYLSRNQTHIARHYLQDAHYAYQTWGAVAKVKDLEARYPQFIISTSTKKSGTTTTLSTTGSSSGEAIDLATVVKASQAIAGEIVLDKLLAKLIDLALQNAGAQTGYLILSNNGELFIEAEASGDRPIQVLQSLPVNTSQNLPLGIINYVARTQENIVLSDATKEGIFTADPYITTKQPKSILCAPIINQGKLVGLLYLENNIAIGAFTSDRLEVVKILSSQAAISIENAILYRTLEQKVIERTAQLADANQEITHLNELLKAENIRMSAELDVTRQLQQMILPKESELLEIPSLEIAGFMEPADEVGGDYYDVLKYGDNIKIGIGDVTGHGLASGVLMIMAQTAVRTLEAAGETDPIQFLNIVNRTLYDNVMRMNSDKNMSLSLLDYSDNILRLSGQHEELIIARADGTIERIDTMNLGFPIALESDIADFIAQTEIPLNPGDVVVLYTDGITEAENLKRVQYGVEQLMEVISRNYHLSASEIKQTVIDDVRRHIGEQKVYDDITLVVLKQK